MSDQYYSCAYAAIDDFVLQHVPDHYPSWYDISPADYGAGVADWRVQAEAITSAFEVCIGFDVATPGVDGYRSQPLGVFRNYLAACAEQAASGNAAGMVATLASAVIAAAPAAALPAVGGADLAAIKAQFGRSGTSYVLVSVAPRSGGGDDSAAAAAATFGADLGIYFRSPRGPGAAEIAAMQDGAALDDDAPAGAQFRYFPLIGAALGHIDEKGLAGLATDGRVRKVSPAPLFSLIRPVDEALAAVVPPQGPTWGIERLGVPELWQHGLSGKGVLVGHLDTGADGTHPALEPAITAFADFDRFGELVSQDANTRPYDSGSHGTHTAATIAGRPVAGVQVGVAPGAGLACGVVIEGFAIPRILAGLEWLVENEVRVISMSLGLRGYNGAFEAVVANIRARNILPVVAVGNEYAQSSRSPGNYSTVLSVGASTKANGVADFSSSERFSRGLDPLVPDLVAPGVATLSALVGGGYVELSGTSMATPHIAGLAALLIEAYPDASAAEIEAAILGSCSRSGGMPMSRANRGMPNGPHALQLLGPVAPLLAAVA